MLYNRSCLREKHADFMLAAVSSVFVLFLAPSSGYFLNVTTASWMCCGSCLDDGRLADA